MSDQDEGQHSHDPKTPPSVQADEDLESPTSDDDVDEMVGEITGSEPKPGQTFNDLVNQAERERHTPPSKDSSEEQ